MTYSVLENIYTLDSGRKVKRLDLRVYGAPPVGVPFQWAIMSAPYTPLTQPERQEIAGWLTDGLNLWATLDDQQADAVEANASPRLVLLDRSSGALT